MKLLKLYLRLIEWIVRTVIKLAWWVAAFTIRLIIAQLNKPRPTKPRVNATPPKPVKIIPRRSAVLPATDGQIYVMLAPDRIILHPFSQQFLDLLHEHTGIRPGSAKRTLPPADGQLWVASLQGLTPVKHR